MAEIEWVETPITEIRIGSGLRLVYPDGATLFGKLESHPQAVGSAHVARIFLGDALGTLPVDVRGSVAFVQRDA